MVLDELARHPVLAVHELDDLVHVVAHSSVVRHPTTLHGLDQPPLDVPGLARLARRVDDAFAAAHGVEKKLLRSEPGQVRVLDEAARLGAEVVLGKVRKRPVPEPGRNSLALHVLLAHARNDLRDVDRGSLGTSVDHGNNVVLVVERVGGQLARLFARAIKTLIDLGFKRLNERFPGLIFQLSALGHQDQFLHLRLGVRQRDLHLPHRGLVGNDVRAPDGETVMQQPKIDHFLNAAEKDPRNLRAVLEPNDVNQRPGTRSHRPLAHHARQELAGLDENLAIRRGEIRVVIPVFAGNRGVATHVGRPRQQQREDLLACP